MGRVLWLGTKFIAGALVGALVGATAVAYFSGAGEPAGEPTVSDDPGLLDDLRARFASARVAGDVAAQEVEAALTQQFRTKVHDPDALNPPNALHP